MKGLLKATIAVHSVELREYPNYKDAPILDTIEKGDTVSLLETRLYYDPGVEGYAYYKVSYKGKIGFIRKDAI